MPHIRAITWHCNQPAVQMRLLQVLLLLLVVPVLVLQH
jgi:hypothetical protein